MYLLTNFREKQAGAELCQAQKCLVGYEIRFKQTELQKHLNFPSNLIFRIKIFPTFGGRFG